MGIEPDSRKALLRREMACEWLEMCWEAAGDAKKFGRLEESVRVEEGTAREKAERRRPHALW